MIRCDKCGSDDNGVTDSRPVGNTIRRRRKCTACGHRWRTYEFHSRSIGALRAAADLIKSLERNRPLLNQAAGLLEGTRDLNDPKADE